MGDLMAWIKLDENCPTNPRIVAAGDRAAWLWIQTLCWSAAHLTDGHVPAGMLLRISGEPDATDLAARLVEVGLFEVATDGWTIHKYGDYQRTRDEIEAQRAAWRERKSRSRTADPSMSRRDTSVTPGVTHVDVTPMSRRDSMRDTSVTPGVTHVDVTPMSRRDSHRDSAGSHADVPPLEERRVEKNSLSRDRPAADARESAAPFDADFTVWWAGWPKKVDRKAAYRRYATRRREGVDPAILLAARDRYVAQLNDPQYCKHGATFLNGSDGPWSEFTGEVAPDTGESPEDVLPPFLALSRVEDKLRARGVPVDVEVLAATVATLGFTGRWYDNPATLDVLAAAMNGEEPGTVEEFAW